MLEKGDVIVSNIYPAYGREFEVVDYNEKYTTVRARGAELTFETPWLLMTIENYHHAKTPFGI